MRQIVLSILGYVVLQLFVPKLWERLVSTAPESSVRILILAAALVCVAFVALSDPIYQRLSDPIKYPVSSTLSAVLIVALITGSGWWFLVVNGRAMRQLPPPVAQAEPLKEAATPKLPTEPCIAEIGRPVPIRPFVSGAALEVMSGTVQMPLDVYVEVRSLRFEKYFDTLRNKELHALCAPIYILNRSSVRLNLRFQAIEMNFSDEPRPVMIYPAEGVETFNLQTVLGPGDETTGCFRMTGLPENLIRAAKRFLLIRELNRDHWLRVPIAGGVFPDRV